MRVKHVMKDGVIKYDIDGHVVKMADAKTVYNLIEQINKRKGEKR